MEKFKELFKNAKFLISSKEIYEVWKLLSSFFGSKWRACCSETLYEKTWLFIAAHQNHQHRGVYDWRYRLRCVKFSHINRKLERHEEVVRIQEMQPSPLYK